MPKAISIFQKKIEKNQNEKTFPQNHAFFPLPSSSLHFQKKLITKSETFLGFIPLGNH